MNWFELLEQKRKLLIGGTVIICLAMLAVTARRYNVSYDSFWHVKIGLDWLEHGLSPLLDHFSFTFNGAAVGAPFIFEGILGWLVMNFGLEPGLQIYKLANFLLIFVLVLLFLRKLRAPVLVYCLVLPLLVVMLQLRAIVRPELISYIFIVLAMMLYYRARSGISVSHMLPIVVLMLIWVNYHSPVFGYVIFIGFFIDTAVQQWRDRVPAGIWLQWFGWGLAVVAVGFLHRGFSHALIGLLFFPAEWKSLIQEYQSALILKNTAAIYALIVISLTTVVLTLKQRKIGLLFVCLFLMYFSVDMARLVTPSGIVILCIFAWMASESELGSQLQGLSQGLRHVIGGTAMILFVLSLSTSVNLARAYMTENKVSWQKFPVDVVDYMVEQGISGRIFNSYDVGGYLIYRLSPDSQVYIDGRTGILYPLEHYYRLMDAERSADVLTDEIEKYDINLAVLKNGQANFSMVRDSGKLGLDFPGTHFSLFRKDNPNFPVLGILLAYPACFSAELASALENEQATALSLLTGDSQMLPFFRYVIDYNNTEDKHSMLRILEDETRASDYLLRFAGHQAIVQNQDSSAYKLFVGIKEKAFSDYLGGAVAAVRMGDWKTAEELLDMGTRFSWSEKKSEISILQGLLMQIRQNSGLELFKDKYINQLAAKTGISDESGSTIDLETQYFCPDN